MALRLVTQELLPEPAPELATEPKAAPVQPDPYLPRPEPSPDVRWAMLENMSRMRKAHNLIAVPPWSTKGNEEGVKFLQAILHDLPALIKAMEAGG